eukprot:jgi/Mesvir1/29238/Mv11419-RA.1
MEVADEMTAFRNAAERGDAELVKKMIADGADVNSRSEKTLRTALHGAAALGHKAVVAVLLRHGAFTDEKDKYGRTALDHSALKGHVEIVDMLIKAGASTEEKDKDGCTLLHWAATGGHKETVQRLLEAGLPINAKATVRYLDGYVRACQACALTPRPQWVAA